MRDYSLTTGRGEESGRREISQRDDARGEERGRTENRVNTRTREERRDKLIPFYRISARERDKERRAEKEREREQRVLLPGRSERGKCVVSFIHRHKCKHNGGNAPLASDRNRRFSRLVPADIANVTYLTARLHIETVDGLNFVRE